MYETVTNPPSAPVKVQGHELQIDPDGVIRTICSVMMQTDGTTKCSDTICKRTRAEAAVAYLKNNNLIINNDGTLVPTDLIELTDLANIHRRNIADLDIALSSAKYKLTQVSKQLKQAREQAEKERVAKANYEQAQKDKALVRVREQLNTLSPDRVAQLVVEGGLDRLGPVGQSARAVLTEAYSTLQASFWIKQNEIQGAGMLDQPWKAPEGLDKFIAVKNYTGNYQAVTGVCSVGALALAKAILNDIPIESFAQMASGDRGMTIATVALAWAIRQERGADYSIVSEPRRLVINWNDAVGTERDEVLRVWAKALECPFLDLDDEGHLYYISCQGWTRYKGAVYASKEAAEEAVRQLNNLTATPGSIYLRADETITDPIAKAVLASEAPSVSYAGRFTVCETDLPAPTLTKF